MDTLSFTKSPLQRDTSADIWHAALDHALRPARAHSAVVAADNCLYFVGGTAPGIPYLGDLSVLDLSTHSWSRHQIPFTPRSHATAALVGNTMVVHGGKTAHGAVTDTWLLNTDTLSWSSLPAPAPGAAPEETPGAADLLVAVGEMVVAVVGADVWVLPMGDYLSVGALPTWVKTTPAPGPAPGPRSAPAAATLGTQILVFGGRTSTGVSDDLWSLEVFEDADGALTAGWTFVPAASPGPQSKSPRTAPTPRAGAAGAVVGETFLVYGGANCPGDLWMCEFEDGAAHWRLMTESADTWPQTALGAALTPVYSPAGLRICVAGGIDFRYGGGRIAGDVYLADPADLDIYHMAEVHVSPMHDRSPLRRPAVPTTAEIAASAGLDTTGAALPPPPLPATHVLSTPAAATRTQETVDARFLTTEQRVATACARTDAHALALADEASARRSLAQRAENVAEQQRRRTTRADETEAAVVADEETHTADVAAWVVRDELLREANVALVEAQDKQHSEEMAAIASHHEGARQLQAAADDAAAQCTAQNTKADEVEAAVTANQSAVEANSELCDTLTEKLTLKIDEESLMSRIDSTHDVVKNAFTQLDESVKASNETADKAVNSFAERFSGIATEAVNNTATTAAAATATAAAAAVSAARIHRRLDLIEISARTLNDAQNGIRTRLNAAIAATTTATASVDTATAAAATLAPSVEALLASTAIVGAKADAVMASLASGRVDREEILGELTARTAMLMKQLSNGRENLAELREKLIKITEEANEAKNKAEEAAEAGKDMAKMVTTRWTDISDIAYMLSAEAAQRTNTNTQATVRHANAQNALDAARDTLLADKAADKAAQRAYDALVVTHEVATTNAAATAAATAGRIDELKAEADAVIAAQNTTSDAGDAAVASMTSALTGMNDGMNHADIACTAINTYIDACDARAEQAHTAAAARVEEVSATVAAVVARSTALVDRDSTFRAGVSGLGVDDVNRRLDDALARVSAAAAAFRREQLHLRQRVLGLDAAITVGCADAHTICDTAQKHAACAVARAVDVEEKAGNMATLANGIRDRLNAADVVGQNLTNSVNTHEEDVAQLESRIASAQAVAAGVMTALDELTPQMTASAARITAARGVALAASSDLSAAADETSGHRAALAQTGGVSSGLAQDRGIVLSPGAAAKQLPATVVLDHAARLLQQRVGAIDADVSSADVRLAETERTAAAQLTELTEFITSELADVREAVNAEVAGNADSSVAVAALVTAVRALRDAAATADRVALRVPLQVVESDQASVRATYLRDLDEVRAQVEAAVEAEFVAQEGIENIE